MNIPARQPLRVWPGVVIVTLQWLARFVVPAVVPDTAIYGMLGVLVCAVALLIWWLFLSRAPWSERLGAIGVMIVGMFVASRLIDKSIATGAQGFLFPILAIPILSMALVAWAMASRRLQDSPRRIAMVATILFACGLMTLVRTGGFTASDFRNDLHWRWAKTPEDRLLAKSGKEPGALPTVPPAAKTVEKLPEPQPTPEPAAVTPSAAPAAKTPDKPIVASVAKVSASLPEPPAKLDRKAYWPGFRGPHRDDIVSGVRIKTDWKASPPTLLWKRPIGPGWSSFAVNGNLIYTQEQRGPDEVVACYNLTTGDPVWAHRDPARFWESNGGPGPRATPTLSKGRVYTFGATGIVNVLNASDGSLVWSHNAASDTGTKTPQWGFASSPLVMDDQVIVATAGQLIAYDPATGTRRWAGPVGGVSYSSPHLVTIDGVPQILLLSSHGIVSVAPADGTLLWEHKWPGYPIVQPAQTPDGDILMSVSDSSGTRRLGVTHGAAGWSAQERWTSNGLKAYFNDFVVHNGHAFGFDGSILACIDLKDGKRVWKGGRYGNGQLLLLADRDVLLVLSEEGEVALVRAGTDQFTELAKVPAIEGKTWNHPVVTGDVLLVRNGEEMAAFRLPLESR